MIKSENEGEIIPPSEELGGMGEAAGGSGAGDEPSVAGLGQAPHPAAHPRTPSVFALGLSTLPRTGADCKGCQEMSEAVR